MVAQGYIAIPRGVFTFGDDQYTKAVVSRNLDSLAVPDTVANRFQYWRRDVARVSLRQLSEAVNQHLVGKARVSVSTVNNYEVRDNEPKVSFLVALKNEYPDLNLDWLMFGEGDPSVTNEQAAELVQKRASRALGKLGRGGLSDVHGFGKLPLAARSALVSFFSDVRLSGPPYLEHQDQPGLRTSRAAAKREESALAEFTAIIDAILFAPFDRRKHFVALEGLKDEEATSYTLMLIAALRPLVFTLRLRSDLKRLTSAASEDKE